MDVRDGFSKKLRYGRGWVGVVSSILSIGADLHTRRNRQ